MYRLVEAGTGRVLQECEGDYQKFLDEKWGGMHPFRDPNTNSLQFMHKGILADMNYTAYWEQC